MYVYLVVCIYILKKSCTSHAILELVEELITNSLDNNKYYISVFIDLRKAFDTVDHDVLATF